MSLRIIGAGCLIVAVVGGGLEGASIEVPQLAWPRLLLLAGLGSAFIALDVWLLVTGVRGERQRGGDGAGGDHGSNA
jgi:hypothetical protein